MEFFGRRPGRTDEDEDEDDDPQEDGGPEEATKPLEQKAEIRDVAEEVVRKLADTLHEAVEEADGGDVAAQWDGYGRFCRETLGVEPTTAAAAFGVGRTGDCRCPSTRE